MFLLNRLVLSISMLLAFVKSQWDYKEPLSQWKPPCNNGNQQSPLDFPAKAEEYATDQKVIINSVHYGTNSSGTVNGTMVVLHNAKYSIKQQNDTDFGYIMVKKGDINYKYDLVGIHFHSNSEHKFNGLSGDLEMHLVHSKNNGWLTSKNITKDPDSKFTYLVVGVMLKVASYKDNENFANINFKAKEVVNFNIKDFPPFRKPFLFYEGGLTTPPCTEAVNWIVVHTMEKISKGQYDSFRSWLDKTYTGVTNNRKSQKLNGRKIYYQFYPKQVVVENDTK